MKNFDWTKFTKRIVIKSELSVLYNAWTKSSEIEKWFLKKSIFLNADKKVIDINEIPPKIAA